MKLNVLNGNPEIFKSFQGEGRNSGQEVVFVRLKGCNLNCEWCDTKDSWKADHADNEGVITLTVEEVKEKVLAYNCNHIVITGGEPLLQQGEIQKLMDSMPGFYFEIETNGTIIPTINPTKWNISPKLKHSGTEFERRFRESSLQAFSEIDSADFKFVIDKGCDVLEVISFCTKFKVARNKVFLMPLGATVEELQKREQLVKKLCKEYGFNYSDRLHVRKYGNKRGV